MKRFNYLFIFLFTAMFACEETILLDIDQAPEKVVIEGLLTDRSKDQYIRVSRTEDFYSTSTPEKVTNAIVRVRSSDGNEYNYIQFSPGYYVPQTEFSGEVGKTYQLTVTIGNTTYTSEDELLRITPVDSLGYRPYEGFETDEPEAELFELLLYFREPRDTKDYYMFKFYTNDTLTYNSPNDIYVTSDDALGESINGFPSPVQFAANDTARMELYSLSRNGYIYYSDLTNLLFSDGGMFGPVPANPRSNISNGALGFFQVSAVTSASRIIKK